MPTDDAELNSSLVLYPMHVLDRDYLEQRWLVPMMIPVIITMPMVVAPSPEIELMFVYQVDYSNLCLLILLLLLLLLMVILMIVPIMISPTVDQSWQ